MRAAILAVGSELLGTDRLDTNSLRAAELLHRYGVELVAKAVVGDHEDDIRRVLSQFLERAELVLISGGLGPTADDITRESVAAHFDLELVEDPSIVDAIRAKFAFMNREMPEINRRQANVPRGARVLDNPRGTAPGLLLEAAGPLPGGDPRTLVLAPGVPGEFDAILQLHLEPWLQEHGTGVAHEMGVVKVACLPESEVEQRIKPAYEEFGREAITILAKPAEITLRFWATGAEEARQQRLQAIRRRLVELIGKAVFSFELGDSLEAVVGRLLREQKASVGTAESCTGGLVAERLTRVAGSSQYFQGALVTYSNDLKTRLADVPESMLAQHGAVSEPVARALAEGARRVLGTDYGIGVTGIAGPGGGTDDKPVGTVHIAVAGPPDGDGDPVRHRRVQLPGDRERIRWQSSQIALEMLRRQLLRAAGMTTSSLLRLV